MEELKELEPVESPANPNHLALEVYHREKKSSDPIVRENAWNKLQQAILDRSLIIKYKYLPQKWYECADKKKELEVNLKIKDDNDSSLHHINQLFNIIDNSKIIISPEDFKELEKIGNLLVEAKKYFEVKLRELKANMGTNKVPSGYDEGGY